MSERRNIVFLGASYAGLGALHNLARHVYPHLPKDGKIEYRILVIDPSSKFYVRHASPRHIVSDKAIPDSLIFANTVEGIEQYGEAFHFVQAAAVAWDPKVRTIKVKKPDNSEETLPYHALVLATGTKTYSPLFSLQGQPHEINQEALRAIRHKIANAKRIVLAGGGPASVELAGELGEMLNGTAGWFASRPANPKAQITVYTSSDKLLPVLRPAVARTAETYLNRVGVDVVYNTRISSAKATDGKTTIILDNGAEIVADVYIPATGLLPMSDYVPKHLLDERGYIKADPTTCRVQDVGPRVFAVGDIATYSDNSIAQMYSSLPVANSNLKRDLLAAHKDIDAKPPGVDRTFKANPAATQIVPISKNYGVGEIFGWRVPSWFVWMLKSKTFMLDDAWIRGNLMGENYKKESVWKEETAIVV